MKRMLSVVVPLAALLVAVPALAEQPSGSELMSLSLETPVAAGPDSFCSAFAVCWDGSNISCTGSSSCSFTDSSCSSQRGYVKCDGVYTWCPACPVCPYEGLFCLDSWECRGAQGCEECTCMSEWERPIGVCVCP